MKSIKTLGLVALAALMAMAFVGASSAMGENTQLCKIDETPCPGSGEVFHVHEVTLTGNKSKLLSSVGNVECDVLILGDSLGLGAPVVVHGHFTLTNCKRGTENCTVTEVSTDTLIFVLRIGHETANVTYRGEFNVHCGSFINCTYNYENITGTAKGPLLSAFENGDVTISEQTLHHTAGLFCPSTGKLDISTMPLEKVYLTS